MPKKHSSGETIVSLESIERFRNSYSERGMSHHTGRNYSSDLRGMLMWSQLPTIPTQDFETYAAKYLNETREMAAPKTTERRLTAFRAFGNWVGLDHPLEEYKAPTPGPSIPHPIPEGTPGLRRMADVASTKEHRCLVGLCGFAGLRVGESLAMRLVDFDLREMLLTVRGKGDKSRVVPISPECFEFTNDCLVEGIASPKAPIIAMSDSSARKAIRSMGRRAKLSRPIKSHDLRATFATEVYNKTRDIRLVQMLLGHASVTTTQVYTGRTLAQMREAVLL